VLNDQRRVIFEQRKEIMWLRKTSPTRSPISARKWWRCWSSATFRKKAYAEQWDAIGLQNEVTHIFGIELPVVEWTKEEGIADEEVRERILKAVRRAPPPAPWNMAAK
jgi:preprotein translocase subunit SecA